MSEFRTITAKFPGKCIECGKEIFAGDTILWSQHHGAKHQTCTKIEENPTDAFVIEEDPTSYIDSTSYTIEEAGKLTKCQKCGASLPEGDKWFIAAYNAGVRRVCRKCF